MEVNCCGCGCGLGLVAFAVTALGAWKIAEVRRK